MSIRAIFGKWALLGAIVASVLLATQARAVGGLEGLPQVGESNQLRPIIEAELGDIPLQPGLGHDGQIYYAMALDLDGNEVASSLDHDVYRYRRIAYPLLASAFGIFDGRTLIYGMIVVTVAATAVCAGSLAAIAKRQGRSDWWALAVLLNPGVWLSVRLLTADVLALALMVLGLLALVSGAVRGSVVAFTASVLTKDAYLITPLARALSNVRHRWLIGLVPLLVVSSWTIWLTLSIGSDPGPQDNLTWPLAGIIESTGNWASLELSDLIYVAFALLSVLVGLIFGLAKRSWLRWSILGWSVLGVISSSAVWDVGNNAARAFAPISLLMVLAWQQEPQHERSHRNSAIKAG